MTKYEGTDFFSLKNRNTASRTKQASPHFKNQNFFINESNIGWAHAFSFAIFPLSPSCECQKVKIITFSYSSKKPKRLRNHRPPLLNHVRCQFCVAHVVERLD